MWFIEGRLECLKKKKKIFFLKSFKPALKSHDPCWFEGCTSQFFPLASSLHFLPPLTLPPMAEVTSANHQWLSATAAVGAWDAGTSQAQVSSFFFNLFFGFTNDFFLQLDYVCMNYDGDDEHMPSPNTEINRGSRHIVPQAPRYVFFF